MNEEILEKIASIMIKTCNNCPSVVGLEELPIEECDCTNDRVCERCWLEGFKKAIKEAEVL
jgi:hypothetical protein